LSDSNLSSRVKEALLLKNKKALISIILDSKTDVTVILPKIKKAAILVTSDN
jgi:predicted DNA-binding protein (UPF0278 family)